MSGTKALLDSNVLIFASKELIDIDSVLEPYDTFYISIITYMEVLGYDFKNEKEKKIIYEMMEVLNVVNINNDIADLVIKYRQKHKIKLPDAIIFSTAKYLGAELLTDNLNDFKGIDKSVVVKSVIR